MLLLFIENKLNILPKKIRLKHARGERRECKIYIDVVFVKEAPFLLVFCMSTYIIFSGQGPLALRMAKRAIDKGVELDTETGLDLEWYCYEQLLHTKDRLEGLAAFAERRKPRYNGE